MTPMVIGIAAFFSVFVSLSCGNGVGNVRDTPVFTTYVAQAFNEGESPSIPFKGLEFFVFTSEKGDYTFEIPKKWASPKYPHDPSIEEIFVGRLDKTRHLIVFVTVGHYHQIGNTASLDSLIAQLQRERVGRIVDIEPFLIDHHPARLLRVHEQVFVFTETQGEIVEVAICERVALIEHAGEIYILHYAASPQLYEEYMPVFEHLMKSFHFTSGKS